MKTILLSLLFFWLSVESFSQNPYLSLDEDFIPKNCYCKSYSIQGPDSNSYRKYTADSLGRVIVRNNDPDNRMFDSIYYDSKGRIIQTKLFVYGSYSAIPAIKTIDYTYSASGKIVTQKEFVNNILSKATEYSWNKKDRPVSFKTTYFDVENVPLVNDSIRITYNYINDTIANLQLYYNGRMIATNRQVYNKKYKIVSETLENPGDGKKVQFVWKYYSNGALKSIQKTKVIGDDIGFINSAHYDILRDLNRKISFEYDSKGRIITKTIYQNVKLDKVFIYRYIYQ